MSGIHKPKPVYDLHASHTEPLPKNPSISLSIPVWKQAMIDEFRAIMDNNTWDLVPREPHMNVIRCMWLFKHKLNADGSLDRYKARLLCDGHSQRIGIDCDLFMLLNQPLFARFSVLPYFTTGISAS
jgi:hypothetical protein